jgi:hypothetical protein
MSLKRGLRADTRYKAGYPANGFADQIIFFSSNKTRKEFAPKTN